jgi:hypothetical protein
VLDQPFAGIVGHEGDAHGLPRRHHDRVEPERFPAVIEGVEQPGAMAMQVHGRRDIRRVGEGHHHGAAALHRE